MITTIFFDVGYTLIHTARSTTETCQQLLIQHGHAIDRATIKTAMQHAEIAHMARYHALHDDWANQRTIVALWLRYYKQVFDQLGLVDENEQLAHALIHWYGQPEAWQPFPEAHAALAELRARGYRLGAVSDWGDSLTGILHAHGLSSHLDWVLASGNLGACKPNVPLYRLALARAQVDPHKAMHIGDSYYADVRGARAAGITPVLIDRAGHAPPLDCFVVRDLRELVPLLESLSVHARSLTADS